MNRQITLINKDTGISIKEAAEKAQVSSYTIRNWIKTKYLEQLKNGFITKKSFDNFLQNIAGSQKLNIRANKSQKDSHNHDLLSEQFRKKINDRQGNIEDIGNEYENSLSNSYRNKEGIYYTPLKIVKDLLKKYKNIDKNNLTFCDPSCGSGNFLIGALEIGFKLENIYGFDIDPVAVEISKARLKEKTGFSTKNIINADFLKYSTDKVCKYDYIFTNPPWGKKLSKNEKNFYGDIFNITNSLDTSILFFFAIMKCLNDYGITALLLPESFFNISVFEIARKKALQYNIIRLVDYGKSFEGLLSKAQAIILENTISCNNKILCECKTKTFYRKQSTFIKNPKSIFNFYCSDMEAKLIKYLFSKNHITLKNRAKWGLGIVTGSNSKFCKDKMKDNLMPVYKGSDITKNGLKKPTVFIPKDTTQYQQVAPIEYYEAKEKLIYKFISSTLCFYCDTLQRYILNSANMMIIDKNFPISGSQTASLLSSDLINWLFIKIFNTHKILRGDLEILPIHYGYFSKYTIFTEENYLDYLKLTKNKDGTYQIKK